MVLSSLIIALWSGGLITGWWLFHLLRERRNNPNRLPLPPGPRGYPIIDNLLDMPTDKSWQVFDEWSKIYGTFCNDQKSTYSLCGIHRRYGVFQDTRVAISCSRECTRDLWSIWETLIQLLWSPAFTHAQWSVSYLSSIDVWHIHLKAGWIIHGTWPNADTGRSGGAIAVPSMIISIRMSSTSTIQLK